MNAAAVAGNITVPAAEGSRTRLRRAKMVTRGTVMQRLQRGERCAGALATMAKSLVSAEATEKVVESVHRTNHCLYN